MNLSSPMATAVLRGVYAALLVFALTTLTTYQAVQSWEDALIAGGVAALGILVARAGIEGLHDQHRAATGKVKPGDVGQ